MKTIELIGKVCGYGVLAGPIDERMYKFLIDFGEEIGHSLRHESAHPTINMNGVKMVLQMCSHSPSFSISTAA